MSVVRRADVWGWANHDFVNSFVAIVSSVAVSIKESIKIKCDSLALPFIDLARKQYNSCES
jgi:hypothetical protein